MLDWARVVGEVGVFMAWFQTLNTDSLCSYTNSEFDHVPPAALKFTGAINGTPPIPWAAHTEKVQPGNLVGILRRISSPRRGRQ